MAIIKSSFGADSGTGNGQFISPLGVATDSSGCVYVVDYQNNRVEKFDSNGNYILQFGGGPSSDPGKFHGPICVAVYGSTVYVTDQGNHRIDLFGTDGTYKTSWGVSGLVAPYGIAVDSTGNVYVTDPWGTQYTDRLGYVFKFSSYGTLLKYWGTTEWSTDGNGDNGKFWRAHGIAVSPSGYVYVADSDYNNRIEKFDTQGNYLRAMGLYCEPWQRQRSVPLPISGGLRLLWKRLCC